MDLWKVTVIETESGRETETVIATVTVTVKGTEIGSGTGRAEELLLARTVPPGPAEEATPLKKTDTPRTESRKFSPIPYFTLFNFALLEIQFIYLFFFF